MNFKLLSKTLCLLALVFAFASTNALAQQDGDDPLTADSKQDFYIVGGIGLAGAILGLSTLSFESDPGEHTDRIQTGAAVGIVIGVIVVAMRQADKSSAYFDESEAGNPGASVDRLKEFRTVSRTSWHFESISKNFQTAPSTVGHSWTF